MVFVNLAVIAIIRRRDRSQGCHVIVICPIGIFCVNPGDWDKISFHRFPLGAGGIMVNLKRFPFCIVDCQVFSQFLCDDVLYPIFQFLIKISASAALLRCSRYLGIFPLIIREISDVCLHCPCVIILYGWSNHIFGLFFVPSVQEWHIVIFSCSIFKAVTGFSGSNEGSLMWSRPLVCPADLTIKLCYDQVTGFVDTCNASHGLPQVPTYRTWNIRIINVNFILSSGHSAYIAFPLDPVAVSVLRYHLYIHNIRFLRISHNSAHKAAGSLWVNRYIVGDTIFYYRILCSTRHFSCNRTGVSRFSVYKTIYCYIMDCRFSFHAACQDRDIIVSWNFLRFQIQVFYRCIL